VLRDAIGKVIDGWSFCFPGIEDVEHVHFYAATFAMPELVKQYFISSRATSSAVTSKDPAQVPGNLLRPADLGVCEWLLLAAAVILGVRV